MTAHRHWGIIVAALVLATGCSDESGSSEEGAGADVAQDVVLMGAIESCIEDAAGGACTPGDRIDFGPLVSGESHERAVRLENTGTGSVLISSIAFDSNGFTDRLTSAGTPYNLPHALAPGATARIGVIVPRGTAPSTLGPVTLTIGHELGEVVVTVTAQVSDCGADEANCDDDWYTGCESLTSSAHCGGCGVPCGVDNGKASCATGTCVTESCKAGYFGEQCAPCPGSDSVCSGHGSCDDGVDGSGSCTCEDGWTGSDCSTEPDGCADAGCDPMAECSADGDEVLCTCKPGYTGTGLLCTLCSTCPVGQGPTSACTATSDTVCGTCPGGTFSAADDGAACQDCGTCPTGQGAIAACTASADIACESCPDGSFSDVDDATACTTCGTCPVGSGAAAGCTAETDIACDACAAGVEYSALDDAGPCVPCPTCLDGQYESVACSPTAPTQCAACHVSCSTCDGPLSDDCTACPAGTSLVAGECLMADGTD